MNHLGGMIHHEGREEHRAGLARNPLVVIQRLVVTQPHLG